MTRDLARLQVDGRGVGVRRGRPQTQTPFIATSRSAGSNAACGGADAGQHPAPVGVVAEDRGLEQVAAGDAAADLDGVVLGGGVERGDRDLVVGALGVAEQLHGEVGAGLGERLGEVGQRRA